MTNLESKKKRFVAAYDVLRHRGLAFKHQDVANKMGASRPNVSAALNGDAKVLTDKFLKRFNAAYSGIFNDEWLLTGEGEMYSKKIVPDDSMKADGEAYYTYLLPMSAAGGSLSGFSDGARLADCEKVVSPIADVDFAITVYGDSMYPDYPSGSRILIKRIDPSVFIAWGNVYVLDTVNGVVVKEVQPSEHDGALVCHSLNPNGKYKDFEVMASDVRAMYRVLACVTMK